MQKRQMACSAFASRRIWALWMFFLMCLPCAVRADLNDVQSFRPIEWDSDFVRSHALFVGGWRLFKGSSIVPLDEQNISSSFGLQLAQNLRDHWQGRVGLFLGQTGSRAGRYVWSFLGSDLTHPLIPESVYDVGLFNYLRPFVFFGLGVTSQWETMELSLHLIPTWRYQLSEPVAFGGAHVIFPFSNELMLSLEYRFLQSARYSRHRGSVVGASIVWGRLDKK